MQLIWFNPDNQKYEHGTENDFSLLSSSSYNEDRFEWLYEFDQDQSGLASKITSRLNQAHQMHL